MTPRELMTLSPLMALAAAPLLVLLAIAIRRHHGVTVWLTSACLFASGALALRAPHGPVTALIALDDLGVTFLTILLAATLICSWLFWIRLQDAPRPEEAQALLTIGALGGAVTVLGQHFASIFLGIATLSVALYGLIAYARTEEAIEAGLKYLILAAASSALFLFGVAVIYAGTGRLRLIDLALGAPAGDLAVVGSALVLVGIAFKLALVPFHHWAPDVYQGALPPAAAFVASVSKIAVLAVALRLTVALAAEPAFATGLQALGGASIVVGNLMALRQRDLRRLLGYSSIAHLGYATIALVAAGARPVILYAAGYGASVLLGFAVINHRLVDASAQEGDPATRSGARIDDCAGLLWRRPLAGAALITSMVSLAGIPLTAGFMAKLYVVTAGASTAQWASIGLLVIGSAIGVVYYLRVVARCFARPIGGLSDQRSTPRPAGATMLAQGLMAVLVGAVIILGLSPESILPASPSRDITSRRRSAPSLAPQPTPSGQAIPSTTHGEPPQ